MRTPPAGLAMGFALVVPAAISASALAPGGLAPLTVTLVVAIALGGPLALIEWTLPREAPSALDEAYAALTEVWTVLLLGALAAPWVRGAGGIGVVLATAIWVTSALAARSGARATPVVVAAACVVSAGAAVQGAATAPPWTLLEPGWATWRTWVGPSVLWGFLLAGAGFGHWRAVPEPAPGQRRRAWAVPGLALVVALLVACRTGSWFEARLDGVDPAGRITAVLLLVAAGTAILERDVWRAGAFRTALAGWLATLWFAWPAFEALPQWWGVLAPLGPAVACGLLTVRTRGLDRAVTGFAAAALAGATVVGWPGAPATAATAAATAMTVVAAVWIAGTRVLMRRPA